MKMNDLELIQIVDALESHSLGRQDSFISDNQDAFKRFMGELYGDEEEHRSKVVSTDVSDVIEADMPSLARVFLGAGEIAEFLPTSEKPEDIKEAEQKNKYIPYIIRNIKDSFKKQHDWLKAIEIYKAGVLEYGLERPRKLKAKKKYKGLSPEEMTAFLMEFEEDAEIKEYKVTSQKSYKEDGEERFDIEVSLICEKQEYFICNVPIEDLILSQNAQTKDDADIVGKRWTKTRGELVEDGYPEEKVKSLPKSQSATNRQLKSDRYRGQGGDKNNADALLTQANTEQHWTMEEVSGVDVYVKVDYDGDGIRERRHIIKCGSHESGILLNEDFDHVPYAIVSSILMPHNIIGRSRAEITMPYQKKHTVLERALLDNTYMVNAGRNIISNKINSDDMLAVRHNGIIRYRGEDPITNHVYPLITPYVGDKTLQVLQYSDSRRAMTTGSLMANQGLEQDDLYKETATRFKGTEEAAKAKVELLARVIAETGYKQLYEGLAWFAAHYQDDEKEITVLGEQLIVDPGKWKYEHYCEAQVGTGAGDDEQGMSNDSALLAIQEQLKARGSILVDDAKIYNTVKRIARRIGIKDISRVVNNPDVPEQTLMAQVEQLTMMVAQYEQMSQNPLAEAEMVTAKKELALQAQKLAQDDRHFMAKLMMDARLKAADMQLKRQQATDRVAIDITRLELEHNTNLNGGLDEQNTTAN